MDSAGVMSIQFDDEPDVPVKRPVIYKNTEDMKRANCRLDLEGKNERMEYTHEEPMTEEESKSYLNNLMDFVKTDNFDKLCGKWEKKSGYSKKKIAEAFFQRILGTIGDFGCIGCDTFESVVHKFVSIVSNILKLAVTIITKIAKAGFRIITLNYTRG